MRIGVQYRGGVLAWEEEVLLHQYSGHQLYKLFLSRTTCDHYFEIVSTSWQASWCCPSGNRTSYLQLVGRPVPFMPQRIVFFKSEDRSEQSILTRWLVCNHRQWPQ